MTAGWWRAPVTLRLGLGAVADVGAAAAGLGRRALVVTDVGVAATPAVPAVTRSLAGAGVVTGRLVLPPGEPDPATARRIADAAREVRADVVVGVGGGAVLDAAKLGVAVLRDPAVAVVVADPPDRTVLELPGARAGRPPRLVLVPTTHGTGAEVSGVASLRTPARKHLAAGPDLWADVAVVDPELGIGLPPSVLRSGALETWCRVLAGYAAAPVASTTPSSSDAHAVAAGLGVVAAAAAVRDGPSSPEVHLELAAAAATTALGWAGLGRDPHGSRLWQAQNELSAIAGVAKDVALPAMLSAYVRVGVRHDSTLGVADRIGGFVASTLPGDGPAPDRVEGWLVGLGARPARVPDLVAPPDRSRLEDRVASAWTAAGAERDAARMDARRLLEDPAVGAHA